MTLFPLTIFRGSSGWWSSFSTSPIWMAVPERSWKRQPTTALSWLPASMSSAPLPSFSNVQPSKRTAFAAWQTMFDWLFSCSLCTVVTVPLRLMRFLGSFRKLAWTSGWPISLGWSQVAWAKVRPTNWMLRTGLSRVPRRTMRRSMAGATTSAFAMSSPGRGM